MHHTCNSNNDAPLRVATSKVNLSHSWFTTGPSCRVLLKTRAANKSTQDNSNRQWLIPWLHVRFNCTSQNAMPKGAIDKRNGVSSNGPAISLRYAAYVGYHLTTHTRSMSLARQQEIEPESTISGQFSSKTTVWKVASCHYCSAVCLVLRTRLAGAASEDKLIRSWTA